MAESSIVSERPRADRSTGPSPESHDVFDEVPMPLLRVRVDGTIVDANRAQLELLGYARQEFVGRPLEAFLVDPERAGAVRSQLFSVEPLRQAPVRLRRRDGAPRDVVLRASRLEGAAPEQRLVAVSDVSESHWVRDALREGERHLRAVFHGAADGMLLTDDRDVIVDANPAAGELLHVERWALLGHVIHEWLRPIDARAEEPPARPDERSVMELQIRRQDGTGVAAEITVTPRILPGRHLYAIRDVSERRRANDARRRLVRALRRKNFELARADRAKDRFLAGMSHELRTPLHAILGFLGTVLTRAPGPLTSDQDRQLRTAQESARGLLAMINDLLDAARIGSGTIDVTVESVDVVAVVHEAVESLRPLGDAKGIELRWIPPRSGIRVKTDRRALHRIVINLLGNAIKFTERGWVRVGVSRQARGARGAVRIRVRDTGRGITSEDRDRIFRAYERGGSPSGAEGTGLGLYLSRNLARAIGGRLSFRSVAGAGSTFVLRIPER